MTLTEMRAVLVKRNLQLTKSLGQNFLHDGNQLRRIADAAGLTKTDKVLEIGPGLGPLTELLLERAGEVFAIEKDGRLVEFLQEHFGLKSGSPEESAEPLTAETQNDEAETAPLCLLHDDALVFLKREQRDWTDWKLVANLPYSVASPILVELAQAHGCPQRLVATLQLEVAKRLMATVKDDDYGVLTLLVQLRYEARDWFKIPCECFFPVPEVDSACVVLERRTVPLLPEAQHAAFEKIVKRAFSQRRKMMLKLLKQDWSLEKLTAAFTELNISPMERGEKLSLEQFVALTRLLLA
jgi:16S rRNA (adenine1518-N6/adenine1519-N6)-dimethyltransferase